MRIAVIGLGAVGGLVAARLARAGHDVAALAR
ncbi:MAG TPA: 2-dehydropantoate 2-reductase N-terminal domain-containing protein, partial [Caldimonas sp.]|nr:2-dehydropantoate 2-reductase N-terminal domain-containing protein [Caldimonas sp.]